ncbi:MAG: helix-turn-helix domain-containing protein [Desulforhopalus sp.]
MTVKRKATVPSNAGTIGKIASKSQTNTNLYNSSPVNQQDQYINSMALTHQALILLGWLKHEGKINTLEARRRGINHPAGRVNDLRNKKIQIDTHWTHAISQTGKVVKVAMYVLKQNPQRSLFGVVSPASVEVSHEA